jgi:hypothetical protein
LACERMPAGNHVSHRTNNTFVLSPTSHVHKSAPSPMSTRNCGHSNSAATEQRAQRAAPLPMSDRLVSAAASTTAPGSAQLNSRLHRPVHQMAVIRQPPRKKIRSPRRKCRKFSPLNPF